MTGAQVQSPSSAWPRFLLLAAGVVMVEALAARSRAFLLRPELFGTAVTFDLVVCVPLLYWWLVVRPGAARLASVIPVFVLSAATAGLVLPAGHRESLRLLGWVVPLLELGVLAALLLTGRRIVRAYREARPRVPYADDALSSALDRELGAMPAIRLALAELTLLYYSVAGPFLRYRRARPADVAFEYHRRSGFGAMLLLAVMLTIPETLALHLILGHFSPVAAWVATALSLYGLLWFVGLYHAMRLKPIVLAPGLLHVSVGLLWRVDLELSNVCGLEPASGADSRQPGYLDTMRMGHSRLVLVLREPVEVRGPLGVRRTASRLAIPLDDEAAFRDELARRGVASGGR